MEEVIQKIELYFKTDGVTLARNLTLILLFFMIGKLLLRQFKKQVNKNRSIEKTLPNFIISLLNVALITFLIVFLLIAIFKISADSVVTIASVLTLGISLALQDTISSLANGILIIVTKPFVEGEYVTFTDCGVSGTVVSISMFNTTVKTADGLMTTIPNSTAVSNCVTNYSRLPIRRVDIEIPVAYGTKSETLIELALKVAKDQKGLLDNPEPSCRLNSYGDSNLNFMLRVWVPGDIYWDTKFDLQEKLLAALEEANISIDYNQYDIHIKDLPSNYKGDK